MLDFTELSADGEDLELMVRELCLAIGYRARWSGRGADAGRDLLLEEAGDSVLGTKVRRWLVSCKHMALANAGAGRSVSGEDLGSIGGIADAVDQHGASAFLLVTSTQPSSAVVTRLEDLERRNRVLTHVWDSTELERMLSTPRGWAVAQRFMPVSADAAGWRIFATEAPNRFVGITRGYYIRLANRHGSRANFLLESVDERLDAINALTLPAGHSIRPRGMFHDDKHGSFVWYLDYIRDRSWPPYPNHALSRDRSLEAIGQELGDGSVTYNDRQSDSIQIHERQVDSQRDGFDQDHYTYYDEVPSFV